MYFFVSMTACTVCVQTGRGGKRRRISVTGDKGEEQTAAAAETDDDAMMTSDISSFLTAGEAQAAAASSSKSAAELQAELNELMNSQFSCTSHAFA